MDDKFKNIIFDYKIKKISLYSQPFNNQTLFYYFKYSDLLYCVYIIRDQTVYKNDKKLKIDEVLIWESSKNKIEKMLNNGYVVLKDFIDWNNAYTVGRINDKIFEPKIKYYECLKYRLPCMKLTINKLDKGET